MEDKVLAAEIRSEKAVRRISAALGFVLAFFIAIILLTSYLKFKPKEYETITDEENGDTLVEVEESKLDQFLEDYTNKAYVRMVLISFSSALLCYLPSCLADVSTLATGINAMYFLYQKSFGNISKFPNGAMIVAICLFGASLYCAVKRRHIYNTKGVKFKINPLIPISSIIFALGAYMCKRIVNFKLEYEMFNRLADKSTEEYLEKDWGDFKPFITQIETCVESDYISIAIVLAFVAAIILVLHNFPRLASLTGFVGLTYTIYKMTVGNVKVAAVTIFFAAIFGAACAVCAVSAMGKLKPAEEYDEAELDENIEEDFEDEAEYIENKQALEKNGLDMEDF